VPDSFEALSVLVIALVPGAVFTYALERTTGAWGSKFTDRLLRFVVVSLVFELIAIPIYYGVWRQYSFPPFFATAQPFPHKLYIFVVIYLAIPAAIGAFIGWCYGRNHQWVEVVFRQLLTAPRAWDHLFSRRPVGYVRVLLKGDPPTWVAGGYVTSSQNDPHDRAYVGHFPEQPDLYCPIRLDVHPETGRFRKHPADPSTGKRKVKRLAGSLLVDGGSIAYLEFYRGVDHF
jgi:hypothetical protein